MVYRPNPLYLLEPVVNTPEVQDAMGSFLSDWLSEHELADGSLLHHYTTLGGMQGIIRNRALWCGHVSSFNDPLEIQYGQKIVTDLLNEIMEREDRKDVRAFLRNLLVQVRAFGKTMFHTFIACFCESPDLLSQWRAYADRGGGYCLGIGFTADTHITSDREELGEGIPLFLRKVIYDEHEQHEFVQRYVEGVMEGAKKAMDRRGAPLEINEALHQAAVMAMQAANVLLDMLLCFKHPAFREEKEWRLVRVTLESHQPENLQFRETDDGLVPYRPTHIYDLRKNEPPQFPLCAISFGPTLEPVRTRSAIELLLHHIAADHHPIALIPHLVQIKEPGYGLR